MLWFSLLSFGDGGVGVSGCNRSLAIFTHQSVEAFLDDMEKLFSVKEIRIAKANLRAVVKYEFQESLRKSQDVANVHLVKTTLSVNATKDGLTDICRKLKEAGISYEVGGAERRGDETGEDGDCGLCCCMIEDPYQLQACGHIFCRECITHASVGKLPICCPECSEAWVLRDAVALLGAKALEEVE